MKILLATGVESLDMTLSERVKNVDFVDSVLYKEAIEEAIDKRKPDIVILSELLQGVTPTRELILTLRTRYPKVRIIFLLSEENPEEEAFLYHWMIFDVFSGEFTIPQLEKRIFQKTEFHEISGRIKTLEAYMKDPSLTGEKPDIRGLTRMKRGGVVDAPNASATELYQELVAFWSVHDNVGRSFSAINTSLLLASNRDLKVLLLDLNLDNPSFQLQFGFADANRNLGAIFQDYHNGDEEVTKEELKRYLVVHPDYPNLHVLPGNILRLKNPPVEGLIKLFDSIINAAKESNYTTILVDTGTDIHNEFNVHVLQAATNILLHVNESPGSAYAAKRMFDTKIGPFIEKLIDKEKINVVVTQSHEDTMLNFRTALQHTLERHVKATIPYYDEVRTSIFRAEPLIANKPPEDIYNAFVYICNLIHNNLFSAPITINKKKKKKKEKKPNSLFGGGAKK